MRGAALDLPNRTLALAERYRRVRALTRAITAPLELEDCVVQTIDDVSPPKWHLGHTTWFFETFVLGRFAKSHRAYDDGYSYLFNSYYEAVGNRVERARRGTLSRPTVAEVCRYREAIDDAMLRWLGELARDAEVALAVVELGLQHEEQHQELLLTDIQHILASNPSRPRYVERTPAAPSAAPRRSEWVEFEGGRVLIGHAGGSFGFDNEFPRHAVWLEPFALASRLVTNGEYLEFVADRGYSRPELWLSDGWNAVQRLAWTAPLYWERDGDAWLETTLHGRAPLELDAPVVHVAHFEADAFARWRGARLPTEFEWEHAAESLDAPRELARGNLFDGRFVHPRPAQGGGLSQMFGDVWEWTGSAYLGYPGFRPLEGALGEYNGKFMSGQLVLRGGSCATPRGHVRSSYRNFFQPEKRWQFTGLRLARAQ